MAGRGPAPGANPNRKSAGQRRRRNTPEAPFEELPAEGHTGPFPALARSYSHGKRRVKYLAATRDWYETWARSPMATRFLGTDWTRLRLLAPLVDQAQREASPRLLGEIRLQESLLGATVMDRQRLRMRVAAEDEPEPEHPQLASVHRLRARH